MCGSGLWADARIPAIRCEPSMKADTQRDLLAVYWLLFDDLVENDLQSSGQGGDRKADPAKMPPVPGAARAASPK